MYKNKLFVLVFAIFIFSQFIISQNNTNSPYTRFGYGDISDTNNGEQRAMGGIAIGSRSNFSINNVNPASYSCVDSMTFMFDVGASTLISRFTNQTGGKTTFNGNLEYITLQFPLAKWLGFSAGALPYSFSGYDFFQNGTKITGITGFDSIPYRTKYWGQGGFSQVYSGLSANLFNHISLGINAYYLFGNIDNKRSITTENDSTLQVNSIIATNFRYRLGAQFYNTFAKKHDVTLGFIYEPKARLNGGFSSITTGVLTDSIPNNYEFELPTIYGIGLNYTYDKRLSVGIDYTLQSWSDTKFYWDPVTSKNLETLNNRSKLAIGVEYLPNPKGRKYFDRIHYRGGFNTSDSYFNINGQSLPKNYGLSFGIGLPLRNSNTMINASFEYGKIGSTSLLSEDYFKFTFNATFNEHWFFKRKL